MHKQKEKETRNRKNRGQFKPNNSKTTSLPFNNRIVFTFQQQKFHMLLLMDQLFPQRSTSDRDNTAGRIDILEYSGDSHLCLRSSIDSNRDQNNSA
jgi:hypothetical protein